MGHEPLRVLDRDSIQSIQLKEILNDKDMFQVYLTHLSKEFSMKLMLAFIECIQLQKYIFNTPHDLNRDLYAEYLFHSVHFYDSMVKSHIVYTDDEDIDDEKIDDCTRIKKKANKICLKYIEWHSQYEILISKNVREAILDTMSHLDWIEDDDITLNDVMELFNDCCKEILRILLSRFGRFQATTYYETLNLTKTVQNYHSII